MRGFYRAVVRRRALILTLFLLAAAAGLVLRQLVYVNYDVNDYLPEGTASTVSVHVLEREFDGGIPNVRVMVRDVTIPEALEYKARLAAAPGVQAVTWLDDGTDVTVPLSAMDADTLDAYYRDGAALFTVTVSETDYVQAIEAGPTAPSPAAPPPRRTPPPAPWGRSGSSAPSAWLSPWWCWH